VIYKPVNAVLTSFETTTSQKVFMRWAADFDLHENLFFLRNFGTEATQS